MRIFSIFILSISMVFLGQRHADRCCRHRNAQPPITISGKTAVSKLGGLK